MAPSAHFRALARRPVSLSAVITAADGSWTTDGSIVDLGLGGAGLLARQCLEVGTCVKVQLVSPTLWDPLVIDAAVRWTLPSDTRGIARVGLCFEPATGHQLRALADLIASTAYE